jgi:hypothetical protein
MSLGLQAQYLQSRLLEVSQENVAKFEAAVAEKTKMYNSKEGQPRYLTFRILTGPNAQNYVRMQYAQNISEFDKVDKVGNDFWFKTTGKLHTSKGNTMLSRNKEASYIPKENKMVNHRRILIYKIKPGKRFLEVPNPTCEGISCCQLAKSSVCFKLCFRM